ncbi:MAG: hypothetical protein AAGI45_07640 [Cyanobacteria bacterium P01_H01_bin.26]
MDIQERISRQRVQHIIDSYQLDGDDGDVFVDYLDQLLETYAYPLIELALTEAIIKGWSEIPMRKGLSFIHGVHERLRFWQPDRESLAHIPRQLKPLNPRFLGATSLGVRATNQSPIDPTSVDITLTPEQFEQITGLDASLVFDQEGRVLTTRPIGTQKPLEPQ